MVVTLARNVRVLTGLLLLASVLAALLVAAARVLLICALTERVGLYVRTPVRHINAAVCWQTVSGRGVLQALATLVCERVLHRDRL